MSNTNDDNQHKYDQTEAIFVPIDLEASLGRIEDSMDSENHAADSHSATSKPLTKTTVYSRPSLDEFRERGPNIVSPMHGKKKVFRYPNPEATMTLEGMSSMQIDASDMLDANTIDMMSERNGESNHGDDFSLTSHEAGSLMDEGFGLEDFTENPSSFWLEGIELAAKTVSDSDSFS